MKTFKKVFVVILVLVVLAIGCLAYFGFVPVLSKVMGVTSARNLGVKYTQQNYADFNQKANVEIKPVKEVDSVKGKGIEFAGKTAINQSFSQEDISARLNYSTWKYMPVSNTQIKINQDGSVEFSANLNTNNLPGFIEAVGGVSFSQKDVDQALGIINKIAPNPAIYAKFTASVTDNDLTVHVESLQVGRLDVPLDKVGGDDAVKALAEHIFSLAPGLSIQSLNFDGGKMTFKGTAPSIETVPTQ